MSLANVLHYLALGQATGAGAPPGQGTSMLVTVGGPFLMFLVIYLLLIRPAGKQRREHANMLSALKIDDEVVTTGGIVGRIAKIDDRIVTLEVADRVKVRVLRDRIAGRFTAPQTQSGPQAAQKK